jgi:AcrR family transcriptional regulator
VPRTKPKLDEVVAPASEVSVPTWRDRAVTRSLERSRVAAEQKSGQFVTTALALVEENGGKDFTVQDVVERMRVSTRTFYQYFSGKEELLVAMFEELQRDFNRGLRRLVDAQPDPLARLETFVLTQLKRSHEKGQAANRLMIQEFFQLQLSHPDGLRESYAPVLAYLSDIVADAAAAGSIISTDHKRTAALIMQMVTSATQASVIGSPLIDPPASPEEVWQFCLRGVGAVVPAEVVAPPARKRARSTRA